ncbi:MAG: pyridoxal-phosphate dependent enzyme [Pseudomonadales bacterium]|nr:pyridoxal-phosphate dependent enzyme [Pseudomonadales bacterium]
MRTDLLHPELSGNKWYKLKYNLQAARTSGFSTLLSFGGAWSNHLHALAAAGRLFGFATIGVVRGDSETPLNPCLQDAVANGMRLVFVDRASYRRQQEPAFIDSLRRQYGHFYLIPEGGANLAGMQGCAEIPAGIRGAYDHIALACGTGTTLAGLVGSAWWLTEEWSVKALTPPRILGFQALKGRGYLSAEIQRLLRNSGMKGHCRWSVNEDYHFGGYARTKPELLAFIEAFERDTGIPLEPVYSGKVLYGLQDLIKRDFFPRNSRILFVHGGGLQGRRGFRGRND